MVSESTYLFGGLRSRKLPALDLPVDDDSPAGGASINYGSHLRVDFFLQNLIL